MERLENVCGGNDFLGINLNDNNGILSRISGVDFRFSKD